MVNVTREEEELLDKYYLDPGSGGSFAGGGKLLEAVKRDHEDTTLNLDKVEKYLQNKSSHYLYRGARRRFPKARVIVSTLNELLAVDLMDMRKFEKENDGIVYILVGVDMFSRRGFAFGVKDKTCKKVMEGFKSFFAEVKYDGIYADKGGEFICKELKKYLDSIGTIIYFAGNIDKVSIAERFIQTFRRKIKRYQEANNTYRYIDVLDKLVHSYNQTFHSSIGTSPNSVTEENASEIYQYQYLPFKGKGSIKRKRKPYKFNVGDEVRVSDVVQPKISKESVREKWSEEIFKVVKRKFRQDLPVYQLDDLLSKPVSGWWYESELYPAELDLTKQYKIDPEYKVKTKTEKGKKYIYVKWQGWPEEFNEWIPEEEYQDIT